MFVCNDFACVCVFSFFVDGNSFILASVDFIVSQLSADGLDNVHTESVKVPHWVRGEEWAELILPRHKPLAILGLGTSIATPPEGLIGEGIVVTSFDDLQKKSALVKGKIVIYNQPWVSYGVSVAVLGTHIKHILNTLNIH